MTMEMDKYEQEIFNFLSAKENFEAMVKVNNSYDLVRTNLLIQFWDLVSKAMTEKIPTGSVWIFDRHNDIFNYSHKIFLYKQTWCGTEKDPYLCIAWERMSSYPYFGVWCNVKSKEFACDKVVVEFDSYRRQHNYKGDRQWWPVFNHAPYNFEVQSEVIHILPDERNALAEKYASLLIDLALDVESKVDEVVSKYKVTNKAK